MTRSRLASAASYIHILAMVIAIAGCREEMPEVETESFGFGQHGVQLDYSARPIGSAACAQCHVDHSKWQKTHHMALASRKVTAENHHLWFSVDELNKPSKWPANAAIRRPPRYQRGPEGIFLVAGQKGDHSGKSSPRVGVDAVFGSLAHALGPISIEDGRSIRELSVSFSAHHDAWILTPGQEHETDPLGSLQSVEDSHRCMSCHMTRAAWRGDRLDLNASVFGVQCERCHGPGSAHVEAVVKDNKNTDIFNPGALLPVAQVRFCSQCHREAADLWPNQILEPHGADEVARHAGAALMLSACYRKSSPEITISCLECHNPHKNIENGPVGHHFNKSCLRCHRSPEREHADQTIASTSDCVSCHMAKIESKSFDGITFTNHWIRNPDSVPPGKSGESRREYARHMESVYRQGLLESGLGPQNRADLHVRLAQILFVLGNTDEAVAHCSQALEAGPGYGARLTIADSLIQFGQYQDGVRVLQDACRAEPGRSPAYLRLVRLHVKEVKFDLAGQVMQRWSQNIPGDPLLGMTLISQGKLDQAAAHFEQALEIDPDSALLYLHLGNVSRLQGKLRKAIGHYQKALKIEPEYVEAHVMLGKTFLLHGRLPEGVEQFRQALEINPEVGLAHASLGLILASQGKHDEATRHLHQALEIDATLAETQFGLGLVNQNQDRLRQAIQRYRQCLKLKPDFVVAANKLAWILATSSDASVRNGHEAVRLAEHAADLTGHKDAAVLDTLAAAYAESGRFADAERTAGRALERMGSNTTSMAQFVRHRLNLYRANKPFRQK